MEPLRRFGIELSKENYREAAIYGLASIYLQSYKEFSDYLKPYDLTLAKFNALMVIEHQGKEKGLSQIEIGKLLIVTASNITRLIDKLEKEKLIERVSQKGDRRINLVRITQKGTDLLEEIWPGYCAKIKELTTHMNKKELSRISGLILK
ncbi:MAG: MarR family transcriptional regulator [Candidatus Ratteibacteria bacterium]|nr:MarR family transcriptional regulator [Candidatus Ratteibacteria bacterium]